MSYYMMAARFWLEVGMVMGALPIVAVSVRRIANAFSRSVPALLNSAPHSTHAGPASC